MRLPSFLLAISRSLLSPALIGTTYLYLYPIAHQCAFPLTQPAEASGLGDTTRTAPTKGAAPFRLLALADPQLEGDTSLPQELRDGSLTWFKGAREGFWAGVEKGGRERAFDGVRTGLFGLVTEDVPRLFSGYRKKLDLWGNDLYLAHIYRLTRWWTEPTHVVVLGDLLGSQWIDDDEFAHRTERFWDRVFKGSEKVPSEVTHANGRVEGLGNDARWRKRLITVAGNHDIGYAGDINTDRVARFEEAYGKANWEIRFRLNNTSSFLQSSDEGFTNDPELHLVILNSMNLDMPAWDQELQQQSLEFLEQKLHLSIDGADASYPEDNAATILLTHLPLHKQEGVCVDAPYFSHFPSSQGGGIKEQNHLSEALSQRILDGLTNFSGAVVLNGHDHEGCDTLHYLPSQFLTQEGEQSVWRAEQYQQARSQRQNFRELREITVRSIMGDFGGNAGFLSAWWEPQSSLGIDTDKGQWRFEYSSCMFGVQHLWWAIHVLDIIVVLLGTSGLALAAHGAFAENRQKEKRGREAARRWKKEI